MKITISVPTPCHEDWNTMSPAPGSKAGKGRHCAQCDHMVADLTTATDAQLVALFTSDAKPKCARFDVGQLDRALGATDQQRARAVPMAAFTSLLSVAAGHEAIAQPDTSIMVGEPAIEQPPPPLPLAMGKPMFVAPQVVGDTVVVSSPPSDPLLQKVELGNVSCRLESGPSGSGTFVPNCDADVPIGDPRDGNGPLGISGFVQDANTGRMLAGAIIELHGTGVRVRCDYRGYFGVQVPTERASEELILVVQVPGAGEMLLPVDRIPFYAPIKFRPDSGAAAGPPPTELQPVVIQRERFVSQLGGACVVTYHHPPPSFWQRLTVPFKRGWYRLWH